MKKQCKVKFEGANYTVSFHNKVKINRIKIKLFAKRQLRRFRIVFTENNFVYCFIILCWSLFTLLSWIWGKYHKGQYLLADALWDLKNPIFSSVFLALVINGYNKVKQYKSTIRAQHYFYVDTMYDFRGFLFDYLGELSLHYFPFYNDLCVNQTKKYIHQHYTNSKGMVEKSKCYSGNDLERIYKRLELIEEEIRKNRIIGITENTKEVLERIKKVKENIMKYQGIKSFKEEALFWTISSLYEIVDLLRQPWRRDIKEKIKILRCLNKYPQNEIVKNYYYSMLLFGYKGIK